MKRAVLFASILIATSLWPHPAARSFLDEQLAHSHVKSASEKDAAWRVLFAENKLRFPPHKLLLIAFKREAQLEVWAAEQPGQPYSLVKTFRICATSGELGPKRRYGDSQVPEGFYVIDQFNPESNYYLSLHVSYPNSSDRILGSHSNPGGDIFVRGNCVTIGCIPITDDGIKQIYWLAALARQSGEKHIPIWIYHDSSDRRRLRGIGTATSRRSGSRRLLGQPQTRLQPLPQGSPSTASDRLPRRPLRVCCELSELCWDGCTHPFRTCSL